MIMMNKQIREYLIKKEEEGVIEWRKTKMTKQNCPHCNTQRLEYKSHLWKYYQKILMDCFGMYRNKWLEKYKQGKFPKCFVPCPPFYDICNYGCAIINNVKLKGSEQYNKCSKCYAKFGFVDYIE